MLCSTTKLSLLLVAGFLISNLSQADPLTGGSRFYERSEEGWFFHDDPPPEPEPVEEPKKESPPPPPVSAAPQEPAPSAETKGPPAFSVTWFRDHWQEVVDTAIDDPSPENVKMMRTGQRIMMDKASAFQDAFAQQVVLDPALDENLRKPVASFGSRATTEVAFQEKRGLLKQLSNKVEIWFFFRSDCSFCEKQAPLLNVISNNSGIGIRAISLDGRPLPSGQFPDFVRDTGQAERLGVMQTPTMFVVHPPNDFVQLGASLLSMGEIEQRLLIIADAQGWVTPEEYDRTRTVKPLLLAGDEQIKDAEEAARNSSDPYTLLQEIRKRIKR